MKRKKIGLALGGGAAKGFAHIGVLKVLEKNNIPIDMVSGTSMGGLIGALHCSGLKATEIENIIEKITWRKLIDPVLPKKGLLRGNLIKKKISENTKENFSNLQKPLFLTATDTLSKKEIIFHKGDLPTAIMATIAIPGIFNPVEQDGLSLVDGGVADILPVEILREKGADIVIAVNVLNTKRERKVELKEATKDRDPAKTNIYKTLSNTFEIMASDLAHLSIEKASPEILISPDVSSINYQDFHKHKLAINKGEEEAKKQVEEIKSSTQKRSFLGRIFSLKD